MVVDATTIEDDDKPIAQRTRSRKRGRNLRVRVPELPEALLDWSLEHISTCQCEDLDINPVLKWVEEGRLPPWSVVKRMEKQADACALQAV